VCALIVGQVNCHSVTHLQVNAIEIRKLENPGSTSNSPANPSKLSVLPVETSLKRDDWMLEGSSMSGNDTTSGADFFSSMGMEIKCKKPPPPNLNPDKVGRSRS